MGSESLSVGHSSREVIVRRFNGGVTELKCGHHRRMRLGGRYGYSAKGEIQSRARIMQHSNRITHVRCSTHYSVDAHVAHGTYYHEFLDVNGIQLLLEISFKEGVDVFFNDHRFLASRRYSKLYLRADRSLHENRRAFTGLMPYVKNRNTCIARVTDHSAGVRHSGFDPGQR
ncbi:hypothetical protein SAMN05444064_11122 [Pseudomonas syringae]|nr:hypothetical protein SAMN05444514_12722 [Pseudomonas syringae]SFM20103.1 hypothetical protein SAMN05444064_11122 [Pseudomonas syringae]